MVKIDNYKNIVKNMLLINELKKILCELNKSGIEIIIIKGAALIETVYNYIDKREIYDIDLLIHKEDLFKIKDKLINIDYEMRSLEKIHFVKKNGYPVVLDIHTGIWYIENIDEIWKSTIKIKIAGTDTLTMSPEDHLIYIIVHSLIEHSQLTEICKSDVECILRYYDGKVDWDKIIEKAKKYNVYVPVYYALSCIERQNNGINIPFHVLAELRPKFKNFFVSKLYEFVILKKINKNIGFILQILSIKGIISKLKFFNAKLQYKLAITEKKMIR